MKKLKIAFAKWRLQSLNTDLKEFHDLHNRFNGKYAKHFMLDEIKKVQVKIEFWKSITAWDDLEKEKKQLDDQYIKALERRVELLEQIMDAKGIKYKLDEVGSIFEQLKLHITAIANLQNKDEIDVVGALIELEIIVDEQADELSNFFKQNNRS